MTQVGHRMHLDNIKSKTRHGEKSSLQDVLEIVIEMVDNYFTNLQERIPKRKIHLYVKVDGERL